MPTVLRRVQACCGAALFFCLLALAFSAGAASKSEPEIRIEGATLYVRDAGAAQATRQVTLPGRITAAALSGPGPTPVIAVATAAPNALQVFNAQLQPLQNLRLVDRTSRVESPVCAIHVAASRQSFVLVFSSMPEMWELSYNPTAPEMGLGMVHDFQYREGHFVPGYLNPQRSSLPFVAAYSALGTTGHTVALRPHANAQTMWIHLDVRKPVADSGELAGDWRSCPASEALPK